MKRHGDDVAEDARLEERLARYDAWIRQGRIPSSSKVIPVEQSIGTKQWILPEAEAREFLRRARSIALTSCECRSRYRRCSNPLEVCLILDEAADSLIREGRARAVALHEAERVLRLADEHGLVHLAIYCPEHRVYAVCSCCSCCCHDLQFLRLYGRRDLIARSEYLAVTNDDKCSHCGVCVNRCVFGARTMRGKRMVFRPDDCFGCGLCVTMCPVSATEMVRRTG